MRAYYINSKFLILSGIILVVWLALLGFKAVVATTRQVEIPNSNTSGMSVVSCKLKNMVEAAVQITVTKNFGIGNQITGGSGAAILSQGGYTYYLTNRHVITCFLDDLSFAHKTILFTKFGGMCQAVITHSDRKQSKAELYYVRNPSDLAILRVEGTYPTRKISTHKPVMLEKVVVVGAPQTLFPVITTGYISGFYKKILNEPDVLLISAGAAPGSSGSPVYNMDGKILGLIFAGERDLELAAYAISNATLTVFIQTLMKEIPGGQIFEQSLD